MLAPAAHATRCGRLAAAPPSYRLSRRFARTSPARRGTHADVKAVVMAGGEGSRLRPLTLERPKPMVTIGNAPAMEHIPNLLRRHGIRDVVVTLHYLGAAIEDYFQSGEEFGLDITYTREDQPLGTAGSVALARELLDEPFLVISGDALTDVDLGAFIAFHRDREAEASLLLYRVPNPLRVRRGDHGRNRAHRALSGKAVVGRRPKRHRQHRHLPAGALDLRRRACGSERRF